MTTTNNALIRQNQAVALVQPRLKTVELAAGGRLAPAQKAAVKAYLANQPLIRDVPEIEFQALLVQVLSGGLFALNHTNSYADAPGAAPGTSIELLAAEVVRMAQRRFPGFKPDEIIEAIRRGAAGDYQTDKSGLLYMSVPNVQGWLAAYDAQARAQVKALVAQSDDALAQLGGPLFSDLPAWHLVTIRNNLGRLLWLYELSQDPRGYPADNLDVLFFQPFAYDWLDQLGVLGSFCPNEQRAAMLDAEVARLAAQPVTAALDGRARQGEVLGFAKLLKDQSASLATHPLMSEAKANCRRALFLAWLRQFTTTRDLERYVVSAWAWAYFSHYQQLEQDGQAN